MKKTRKIKILDSLDSKIVKSNENTEINIGNFENIEEVDEVDANELITHIEDVNVENDEEDIKLFNYGDITTLESILYKIPIVKDPLIGSPKEVQKKLDRIAINIQKDPKADCSNELYNKIHLYMHGYLINVALKQFPYIKGFQTTDIYQESLIALRFKAIPNFRRNKGMSFLNFAKMCIRRHLITILNTSNNRKKDQSINKAVPIDVPCIEDDENTTLANTLKDKTINHDKNSENKEAFEFTKNFLMGYLSSFEQEVLNEYLLNGSYKEIAKNITEKTNKKCLPKAVDNALLRIRKKAILLKENINENDLPLFLY